MTEKQGSILIVDDEASIRKLLRQKLSGEGYQCQEAGNAEQALDKLQSNLVDLVILDIKMPSKSGIELLPEIKASYPDTAVVMATATIDMNVAIQCLKQGAYDYITKPFNLDDVMLLVRRAVEKRELLLENERHRLELEKRVGEQAQQLQQQFVELVETLAREHRLVYQLAERQRGKTKSLLSKLPKELQEPMSSVEEFSEALLKILRRSIKTKP